MLLEDEQLDFEEFKDVNLDDTNEDILPFSLSQQNEEPTPHQEPYVLIPQFPSQGSSLSQKPDASSESQSHGLDVPNHDHIAPDQIAQEC